MRSSASNDRTRSQLSSFKAHTFPITPTVPLLSNCHIFPIAFFPHTVQRSHSDSESEYSASNSEDDGGVAQEQEEDTSEVLLGHKVQAQNRAVSTPVCKEIPSKKMKRDKTVSEKTLKPSRKCV